jgi:hypothetical protein
MGLGGWEEIIKFLLAHEDAMGKCVFKSENKNAKPLKPPRDRPYVSLRDVAVHLFRGDSSKYTGQAQTPRNVIAQFIGSAVDELNTGNAKMIAFLMDKAEFVPKRKASEQARRSAADRFSTSAPYPIGTRIELDGVRLPHSQQLEPLDQMRLAKSSHLRQQFMALMIDQLFPLLRDGGLSRDKWLVFDFHRAGPVSFHWLAEEEFAGGCGCVQHHHRFEHMIGEYDIMAPYFAAPYLLQGLDVEADTIDGDVVCTLLMLLENLTDAFPDKKLGRLYWVSPVFRGYIDISAMFVGLKTKMRIRPSLFVKAATLAGTDYVNKNQISYWVPFFRPTKSPEAFVAGEVRSGGKDIISVALKHADLINGIRLDFGRMRRSTFKGPNGEHLPESIWDDGTVPLSTMFTPVKGAAAGTKQTQIISFLKATATTTTERKHVGDAEDDEGDAAGISTELIQLARKRLNAQVQEVNDPCACMRIVLDDVRACTERVWFDDTKKAQAKKALQMAQSELGPILLRSGQDIEEAKATTSDRTETSDLESRFQDLVQSTPVPKKSADKKASADEDSSMTDASEAGKGVKRKAGAAEAEVTTKKSKNGVKTATATAKDSGAEAERLSGTELERAAVMIEKALMKGITKPDPTQVALGVLWVWQYWSLDYARMSGIPLTEDDSAREIRRASDLDVPFEELGAFMDDPMDEPAD